MSKRPWMPIYIADYLADTSHLTTVQHGAYILLLMHYWQKESLPEDDAQLASIAKMTPREWAKHRPVLKQLFRDGWKHKRVEEEISKTKSITSKRQIAANARWNNSVVSFNKNTRG